MSTPIRSPNSPQLAAAEILVNARPAACVKFTAVGTPAAVSFLTISRLSSTLMPNGFSKNTAFPCPAAASANALRGTGGHARYTISTSRIASSGLEETTELGANFRPAWQAAVSGSQIVSTTNSGCSVICSSIR